MCDGVASRVSEIFIIYYYFTAGFGGSGFFGAALAAGCKGKERRDANKLLLKY